MKYSPMNIYGLKIFKNQTMTFLTKKDQIHKLMENNQKITDFRQVVLNHNQLKNKLKYLGNF